MSSTDFTRLRYDVLAALFGLRSDGRDRPDLTEIEERSRLSAGDAEAGLESLLKDSRLTVRRANRWITGAELEPGALQSAWSEHETYRILQSIGCLGSEGRPYVNAIDVAHHLGYDLGGVEARLRSLSDARAVELNLTHDLFSGGVAARLTSIGEGWVRDGVPANQVLSGVSQGDTYNISGGTNAIASRTIGPVTQTFNPQQSAELRRILDELVEAIRGLDRSVQDRAGLLAAAQALAADVEGPIRDPAEFVDRWTYISRFADTMQLAQFIGVPATIPALIEQARPLVEQLRAALGA